MKWILDLTTFQKKKRMILEGEYNLEKIEVEIGECPVLKPVEVKIVAVRVKDGVAIGGYARTVIEHPCTRCLKPVKLEINGTIEALYVPSSLRSAKKEERLENLKNIIYYTNPVVDLTERIIEAIVMDIPQKVLCSPDCKGLCPYCGVNLNEHPDHVCEKSKEGSIDPRLAILADLKKTLSDGEG